MNPLSIRSRCAAILSVLAFVAAALPGSMLGVLVSPVHADTGDDVAEAARHLLIQSTVVDRAGAHNRLLKAIRHMQDPATRPLFTYLATSEHPGLKIHGILGTAELSDNKQVDLAAIAQIDDPAAQSTCLSAALDDELLSDDQARQLLAWEGLDDEVKTLVAVRLLEDGKFEDAELCRRAIKTSKKLGGRALAALLLVQLNDNEGLSYLESFVDASDDPQRDAVRAMLLQTALRNKFDRIGGWALKVAGEPDVDPALGVMALRTALRFEVPGAAELWQEKYEQSQGSPATRVRLVLTALHMSPWLEPGVFEPLKQSDDPMIQTAGQAGAQIASGSGDAGDAIAALLEFGHPMINAWALSYAEEHASEIDAQIILLGLILAYEHSEPRGRARRLDEATLAVQALFQRDAETAQKLLRPILTDPATDKMLTQAVLLGLVRIQSQRPVDIVDGVINQIHDPDAHSMALLLLARSDKPMNESQMKDLALLSRGGGKLDDSLRIQAAWSYLKRTDRAGQTLASAMEKISHE